MSEPEWDGDEIRRQVAEVLDGHTSYDAIGLDAQRLVREAWASRIAARREAVDLEEEFLADGIASWSEADQTATR